MVNRRQTLGLLGAGVAGIAPEQPVCAQAHTEPLPVKQRWLTCLAQSLPDPIDSFPSVTGALPGELVGTLYRNGPGLFERNGFRKATLLDGDGLIRAFTFRDGKVRFKTRFVATEKFQREAQGARFLYPTWTTPAPSFLANLPEIPSKSQAGVTAVVKSGVLYAFDEVGKPYALRPDTLTTTQPLDPCGSAAADAPAAYKAHTKTDAASGAWVLTGTTGQSRQQRLHTVLIDARGAPLARCQTPNPRGDYFHDFFWTGRHVVFHLHPTPLSPLPMLMGLRTYLESLSWRPELGSLLVVVDPMCARTPLTLEVPATWMWHSVNAYERGNSIIADFIGYDAPDHFFGPDAIFRTLMTGHDGIARSKGLLRRITVDLSRRSARLETIVDQHFEFPTVSPRVQGLPYRFAYCAIGEIAHSWFHDGVAKIDVVAGTFAQYRFGPQAYVGEPVFVPCPGAQAEDAGWLLCEVLDGRTEHTSLAIFDATRVAAGPVAAVELAHSLPFSFHGWWQPA